MLVDRHQSRVRGYLRYLAHDAALADDLAQETFIRAWNKLHTFSGKGSFAAWLTKIAYNQFLQAMRKSTREREVMDDYGQSSTPDASLDIGKHAGTDSGVSDLPKLLSVLSEEERSVIVLGYAYGYSHSEISRITGLAVGTVKSHVYRGKAKIQEHFAIAEVGNA